MSVASTVKSIQDIMRKDAGVDGDAQRLSQLGWMLFLKLFDDREQEYELEPDYRSPIPAPLRWRAWAANEEGITGDDLLDFVDNVVFPALKGEEVEYGGAEFRLDTDSERGLLVRSVFEDAYNYMKSGTLLRQVANKLNEIDFTASHDRHVFNDVYETILRDLQSAGNAGEYYTPRAVTRFMAERTDPELGDIVFDPACGTGGFLVDAIEHLRRKGINSVAERDQLQQTIRGIEKKPLPHLLCTTNLVLHDIEVPDVRRDNSLARPYASYGPSDRVDVVLTNPPFGGTEEDGIENNFPLDFRTRETADLFMALIVRRLKSGGRAAVVLPDGFLFGEGVKTRLKERLLAECDLHTIVRLPNGVFAPYTDINTNLLFFEKGKPTEAVWYIEHPLPEGYKKYTKTKPIRLDEFAYLKNWWDKREETEWAWRVPVEEIEKRGFNIDISNPSEDSRKALDPALVLSRIDKSTTSARSLLDEIEDQLRHLVLASSPSPLGDFLIEQKVRIGSIDADGLPLLGVSNEEGLHRSGRRRIADMSRYLVVEDGWFAYNPMRINVGSIGWADSEELTGVISPDYVTFSCKPEVDPRLVYWLLRSDLGLEAINKQTAGSVRDRLYFSALAQLELPIPSPEDQSKLLRVLDACAELKRQLDRASQDAERLIQAVLEEALSTPSDAVAA